jgi:hypothetical protein
LILILKGGAREERTPEDFGMYYLRETVLEMKEARIEFCYGMTGCALGRLLFRVYAMYVITC